MGSKLFGKEGDMETKKVHIFGICKITLSFSQPSWE
jgi:hypothetical protein